MGVVAGGESTVEWKAMMRRRYGAGWRSGRSSASAASHLLEVVVGSDWPPSRTQEAIDLALLDRLRSAIFAPDGRLRRSIRTSVAPDGDWGSDYLALVDLLGAEFDYVIGWWIGKAARPVEFLGEPEGEVPLVKGTDLDLAVWRVEKPRLPTLLDGCGLPTLAASPRKGWVLFSPPSSNDLFLYPELSASD